MKGHGWLPDGRLPAAGSTTTTPAASSTAGRSGSRTSTARTGPCAKQLFIHTESAAGNRQCADGPGDQICRWEFPKINDYTSHGCIKMSPRDIAALTHDYHRFFKAGVRYPTARVSLLVH